MNDESNRPSKWPNWDIKKTNRWQSWNPFRKLEGEADALAAAKYGALPAGAIFASYLLQVGLVYYNGSDMFGDAGVFVLGTDIFMLVVAALLIWRILARQPVWAAVIAALWFFAELALKVMAIVSGQQQTNIGFAIMFAAISVGAILGVRGSWFLRRIRRSEARPSQ